MGAGGEAPLGAGLHKPNRTRAGPAHGPPSRHNGGLQRKQEGPRLPGAKQGTQETRLNRTSRWLLIPDLKGEGGGGGAGRRLAGSGPELALGWVGSSGEGVTHSVRVPVPSGTGRQGDSPLKAPQCLVRTGVLWLQSVL